VLSIHGVLCSVNALMSWCSAVSVSLLYAMPIPVAVRSKARMVKYGSNTGFESRWTHVCTSAFFFVLLPCVGRGLATG
jgi:hypothetical protein